MVSLQFCDELPCRYTAPPRREALLLIKVQLLTIPKEPIHIIAPPSPPVVLSPLGLKSLLIPNALLYINLELTTVPLLPYQYIDPPLRLAVLLIKIEFITLPSLAPSCQSRAPPLVPAVLL